MQLKSGSKLVLTDDVKKEIQENNGKITNIEEIRRLSSSYKITSVGDVTTSNLRDADIDIFLEVVDLKTKRGEKIYPHQDGSLHITNDPGTISCDLIIAIKNAFLNNIKTRIEVDGEEDLAVLPIIYYSICNTVVVYGIPNVGMALLIVDDNLKQNAGRILERMPVKDK
ncbi:MAG: GTP-dependent dephospho-CoA kinase family protein [Thermoplasmata archaeon]